MFVLVLAVPALLVVVVGYAAGYGLWTWLAGLVDAAAGTSLSSGAEVAGWVTGVLLLVGLVRIVVVRRRARRAARSPGRRPHGRDGHAA